ncbi:MULTISPECIES: GNAT family N-acetyltransferase [Micrococcus]|uniref:GNAT family N-acetyltransferase n=1 Tax=Micrococcus TaxID=1269 RepID=UPI00119F8E3F|nr:GNAT family N-acetyltransferase [Micrococcus luteus]MCC0766465.1 GNAT family N-acetyltransferase [Micrococcus luteus]
MLPDPSPTVTVDGLLLRPLRAADEIAAREADAELHREGFDFLLGGATRSFPAIRRAFAAEARGDVEPGRVPASFYVGVDEAGELLGRVSVRWELNEALRHVNGHVGYAVRPAFRRRGHAVRLLRGALTLLAARGVSTALLTCDETNTPSVATIRACGGVLRDRVEADLDGAPFPEPKLRFDVPTTVA